LTAFKCFSAFSTIQLVLKKWWLLYFIKGKNVYNLSSLK
jgi:hypothetical protein